MRRLDRLCAGLHAGPIQVLRIPPPCITSLSENHPRACLDNILNSKSNSLPKYTQTDFAIFVEIRIEANLTVVCGHKLDARSMYWVVGRTAYYKVKKSTFVRRIKRTSDESVQLQAQRKFLYFTVIQLYRKDFSKIISCLVANTTALTKVIFSGSGTTNIPGGGSLYMLHRSLQFLKNTASHVTSVYDFTMITRKRNFAKNKSYTIVIFHICCKFNL
jgi:hypothetical protein